MHCFNSIIFTVQITLAPTYSSSIARPIRESSKPPSALLQSSQSVTITTPHSSYPFPIALLARFSCPLPSKPPEGTIQWPLSIIPRETISDHNSFGYRGPGTRDLPKIKKKFDPKTNVSLHP